MERRRWSTGTSCPVCPIIYLSHSLTPAHLLFLPSIYTDASAEEEGEYEDES